MTYDKNIDIQVGSEIGKLEHVIVHTPGSETENMTPENAERALYSDILNLQISLQEYTQFKGVLDKVSNTMEVKTLLTDILQIPQAKEELINKVCRHERAEILKERMMAMPAAKLAAVLIEGVPMVKDNLTKYLDKERYALKPLHNFFFTRDASVSINDQVLISKMASHVRGREALVMEAIFKHHPALNTETINPMNRDDVDKRNITIEGGDVLIAREDLLVMGVGSRTTSQGVDFILEKLKHNERNRHILVQQLPDRPESFIHLDMIFTFLDRDTCMVYEPIILQPNRYETVHIEIKNGKVKSIRNEDNLIKGLHKLGMDIKPLYTGGRKDRWIQDREQWHSGANFFAFAPGKVIGYARNIHTIEELDKNGFAVLKAEDVLAGKVHPDDYRRCVVSIEGSELPRGGGGARCMTMPVQRQKMSW